MCLDKGFYVHVYSSLIYHFKKKTYAYIAKNARLEEPIIYRLISFLPRLALIFLAPCFQECIKSVKRVVSVYN